MTTAIGLAMTAPQLVRSVKTRNASGVSVGGLAGSATAYSVWWVYGVHQGDILKMSIMSAPGLLQFAAAYFAWRYGGDRRGLLTPIAMLGFLASVLAVGGWTAYGMALLSSVVWAYAPSIYASWRSRDTSGISLTAWVLAASYGVTWFGYGATKGDMVIMASGVLNFTLSVAVIAGLHYRPAARRATVGSVEVAAVSAA